jgi:hypothetical protein
MAGEPECVFPDQEHSSDVEISLQDGVTAVMRVGSFGPVVEFTPEEARELGLAFQELADRASLEGRDTTRLPALGFTRSLQRCRGELWVVVSDEVGSGRGWSARPGAVLAGTDGGCGSGRCQRRGRCL